MWKKDVVARVWVRTKLTCHHPGQGLLWVQQRDCCSARRSLGIADFNGASDVIFNRETLNYMYIDVRSGVRSIYIRSSIDENFHRARFHRPYVS